MVTRHHLRAWSRLHEVEVVAISARRLESAQARAEEFGIPSAYADVAEMLDKERPDVLDIATPPEVHGCQAMMAAQRCVHILCQKPMTPSLEESERLVAEVGDRVRFMVHENWRFRPYYRQAARWLAEGKVGPIREFRMTTRSSGLITRTDSGRPFALERQPFFANLKHFIILELLIHHLDTIRFLMGPMRVVAASTVRVSQEVKGEDVAMITLTAENGAFGTVFLSTAWS
jgi:predicted dehydrogenase